MMRRECLEAISRIMNTNELFVVSLGRTRTIWSTFEKGDASYELHAMGYVTAFGLGLALGLPKRRVVVIDGDGSLLLNLGVLCTIAVYKPKNLLITVIDNGTYQATGDRPIKSSKISDIAGIAREAGIENVSTSSEVKPFESQMREMTKADGPHLAVAKIQEDSISDLKLEGSTIDGKESKYRFVRHIEATEGVKVFRQPTYLLK